MKTIFFLILLLLVVWFLFFRKKPKKAQKSQQADSMVECKRCKIYILQNEAIYSNGSYFCSNECLLKE